jgi:hypothetical protein
MEAVVQCEAAGNDAKRRLEAADGGGARDAWWEGGCGGGMGKQSGSRPCPCDGEANGASGELRRRLERR